MKIIRRHEIIIMVLRTKFLKNRCRRAAFFPLFIGQWWSNAGGLFKKKSLTILGRSWVPKCILYEIVNRHNCIVHATLFFSGLAYSKRKGMSNFLNHITMISCLRKHPENNNPQSTHVFVEFILFICEYLSYRHG